MASLYQCNEISKLATIGNKLNWVFLRISKNMCKELNCDFGKFINIQMGNRFKADIFWLFYAQ